MKVNVLLEGPIGTGKTHSLRTIHEAGQELFILATEPGVGSVLGDISCEAGCHWAFIPPGDIDWETLRKSAEQLNLYPMDRLAKMPGINKEKYTQFLDVYCSLANFKCDRCKKEFGPVDDWDEGRTIAIDGLTGLSDMALQLVAGSKVIKSLPEWGGAQQILLALIKKLCNSTLCNFVLLSHVSRERDETSGRNLITTSTLGVKLAPEIPKPFDEVIFTRRDIKGKGVSFVWSTMEPEVDQKTRLLPWSDSLDPDFKQLFNAMTQKVKGKAA